LKKQKTAISKLPIIVVVVVVIVIVVAASVFLILPSSKSSTTTIESQTLSTSNSVASSTTSVGSTSSSQVSSTSSVVSGSSSQLSGKVIMSFEYPSDPLVSPDVVANYTLDINSLGDVPNSLSMSAYGPQGLTVQFSPSTITLNGTQPSVVVSTKVSQQVSPGSYSVVFSASANGETYNETAQIQVVKYLVLAIDTSYLPLNLTVPLGSSVTWLKLTGHVSENYAGNMIINFTNGMASSPSFQQYSTWPYTFSVAGNFSYFNTYYPSMVGSIDVTS
jgi:plastocyanin